MEAPLMEQRFCGGDEPGQIAASGNALLLKFHSGKNCEYECSTGYSIKVDLGTHSLFMHHYTIISAI